MIKQLFPLFSKKLVSRGAGFLANQEWNPKLLQKFIGAYRYIYKVDLEESIGTQESYRTFNEFFTRDIDFSKRKVDKSDLSVVSPVDGTILRSGKIQKNAFYSAKGVDFLLEELVGEKNAKLFLDGDYLTIYLSPADHHRIYAPYSGEIYSYSYFNGALLPVNSIGIKIFNKVFCINERLLTLLKNKDKKVTIGILKIGAAIVGGIRTKYKTDVHFHQKEDKIDASVSPSFAVEKADEIGNFELGSMVILLFPKGQFSPDKLFASQKLKVGEKIGVIRH